VSQNATVRGFVYEETTGEPVIFTNVYLHKTTFGAATDLNGYFVIPNIPTGSYTLMITALGYDSLSMNISLKAGEYRDLKLYVKEAVYDLGEVNISAEVQTRRSEVKTAMVNITPKQIEKIPSIGGQADLAQYLQVLPGVIFTGDQGGQLYIRGGSPVQNKVIMDGMIIYNPFHSIGLFSVFDTDMLRNIDVYSGGFGAEYGGRVSSVMDIRTRDGNKRRHSGNVEASTFGAKVMLEGPILKAKEGNSTTITYILSAKNSFLNYTDNLFYKYACTDDNGLPFSFLDIYGKVSLGFDNGSKINFFGFGFNDKVDNYKNMASYDWDSYGGGMNFVIIPGQTPALIEGTVAYSTYSSSMNTIDSLPRYSQIGGFNINLAMSYFYGKNQMKYGIDVVGQDTEYKFRRANNVNTEHKDFSTEIGLFISGRFVMNKLILEPGFRVYYYASLGEFSPEPRLAVKYNINNKWRLKASGGLYSQNLMSASSDRDVVNLFYGFLSTPSSIPKYFEGKKVNGKLQKSQHIVVGIEFDPINHLTIDAEAYYKNFSQLTNVNRDKIFDNTEEFANQPERLRQDYIIEKGAAKGFDISAKYDYKRIYLWFVYSLGFVDRYDGYQTYPTHYDRRHNINILGTYSAGKKYDWEFSIRWNYGSGFPFTLSAGYYEYLIFEDIYDDITQLNGQIGIIYDDNINAGRLPQYHRLDIDAKKTFLFGKNTKLAVSLSVTNVYNRKNIFYVDRLTGERVDQLPILPSLGLNFSF
ncbi:TonB-dependent receptor, partial [Bacteroidales bacterium OttesenSCG-928-K22]|nr:TonB-dependent receptor [Bacteroidales bacterium OttesenSCG-928-K22]